MRTTFIGGGNMAQAMLGGLVAHGASAADLCVVEPNAAQRTTLAARFPGLTVLEATDLRAVAGAAIVVMAVKPQQMRDAARQLSPHVGDVPVVLTIAAGVRCDDLSRWLGGYRRVVRAMPNTPALIGAGISGAFAMADARPHVAHAVCVLESAGDIVWCEHESDLDAITGISGSGPAYVFYFLEAVERAALELGIGAADARRLVYATFAGSVRLAQQSADPPATLRANVTSRNGTTARAIEALDAARVDSAIVDAVKAAARRAAELSDENAIL